MSSPRFRSDLDAPVRRQNSTRRVYSLIRSAIRRGVLSPGASLSEYDLAGAYLANRASVRDALQRLAQEGWLDRRQRSGTFVVRPPLTLRIGEVNPTPNQAWADDSQLLVTQLEHRMIRTNPLVRELLATNEEAVFLTEQLIRWHREPVMVRTAYLDCPFGPAEMSRKLHELDAEPSALAPSWLRLYGVGLGRVDSTVEALAADEQASDMLGIAVGTPLLSQESVQFGVDGRGRILSHSQIRPDRIAVVSSLPPGS